MPSPTSGSPVSKTTLTGNATTDALLYGREWSSNTVSFSFAKSGSVWSTAALSSGGYGAKTGGGEPWKAIQYLDATDMAAVRSVTALFENVSNLNLVEVTEAASAVGDIRLAYTGKVGSGGSAWAYTPEANAISGDIWFSTSGAMSMDEVAWTPGSYAFGTVVHEMAHALGLKHSFEGSTRLPAGLETRSFSVMSYSALPNDDTSQFTFEPTTLMMFDIAAIQAMYGKDTTYQSGNSTYLFKQGSEYHQTIWDAGGTDTIVYQSTTGGTIDLGQGYKYGSRLGQKVIAWDWEDQSGAKDKIVDNIWIAFGTVIENATGGSGNDLLIGNGSANALVGSGGADSLRGLLGKDRLTGGEGADKFKFDTALNASANVDTITDFSVAGGDVIQLENSIFTKLTMTGGLVNGVFRANTTGKAMDGNDYIVYDTVTGKLYYDSDGNGSKAAVQFALIGVSAHAPLTAADFVVV